MYRFRLETLLRRRKQIEDMRQTELSAQRVEYDQANAVLDQVRLQRSKIRDDLKRKLFRRSTIDDLITFQRYLDVLAGDLDNQREIVAVARKKVDEKQTELIDAVKSRKVLDRLKEKESIAYGRRLMQKEQNFMNEIAGNRHVRSRQSIK